MKNKIITWALKGLGTLIRKWMIALCGILIANGFLTEDPTLADKFVAVSTSLAMGLLEFVIFIIRTRNGRAIQRAVGAKPDGVPLEETAKKVQSTAYARGGRPV